MFNRGALLFLQINLGLLVALLGAGSLWAQPVPVPLKHELKVYTSSSKMVYWPMDKPVWIRLASSPEEGAQTFLLQTIQELAEGGKQERQTEGIRLEIPGRQFIRWVNYLTEEETLYKFIADGQPPETNLNLTDAPIYKSSKMTYYGRGLIGTLRSVDDLSGIEDAYISVDGVPYGVYENPLNLNQEKTYLVRHYAVDHVGYASKPVEVLFTVDLTPPTTTHTVTNNFLGDILSQQSVILLTSGDQLSGVREIRYRFDNESTTRQYNPETGIAVKDLPDGERVLHYFAIDQVDNVEVAREYRFELDRTAPEVEATLIGDVALVNDRQYVSPRTRVQLDATDLRSQPQSIQYRINELPYSEYVTPFIPRVAPGEMKVIFKSRDRLGNESEPKTLDVVMDAMPPKSSHEFLGPHFSQGIGAVWLTGNTKVRLSAQDDLAGVQTTSYRLGNEAETTYEQDIVIPVEGQYMFSYWSIDRVNNREVSSPLFLIVDNTPPQILTIFSIDPLRVEKEDGVDVKIFPINTLLYLTSTDNSANVRKLEFALNDEPYKAYGETLFFDKPGRFRISVRAEDNVQNQATQVTEFRIVPQQ